MFILMDKFRASRFIKQPWLAAPLESGAEEGDFIARAICPREGRTPSNAFAEN